MAIGPWARSNTPGYANGGSEVKLIVELPKGTYRAGWVNTKTGKLDKTETFRHANGDRTLLSPKYVDDIALRIRQEPPFVAVAVYSDLLQINNTLFCYFILENNLHYNRSFQDYCWRTWYLLTRKI